MNDMTDTAGMIRIGRVMSVNGASITCRLDPVRRAAPDAQSVPRPHYQIGSLIKLATPKSLVYGIIKSMRVDADRSGKSDDGIAIAEIDLYGEILSETAGPGGEGFEAGVFDQGVTTYPGLDDPVFIATPADLRAVYARPRESNLRVGSIHQDRDLSAYLVTDKLLGKHFAVLGMSGSGKSCAVVLMLRQILRQHPNGHVILLDPHDEYSHCFGEQAECIGPKDLELPYWMLNFQETVGVLVSREGPSREAEIDILRSALLAVRRKHIGKGRRADYITVDSPVPYSLSDLFAELDTALGRLDKPDDTSPYLRLRSRLETLTSDRRFSFMFAGLRIVDNMSEVLARILRIPVAGKPITVLDLSGIPPEITDVVVSLLCRIIFDFAVWSPTPEKHPLLLVCEEAHRYIPADRKSGFEPTRNAIARIAKEGRKYGVSLAIISQRPSEISMDVLTQCNTIIAMRMSNEADQNFVLRALPENAMGLMHALPALQAREAVVVGEGTTIPVRFRFDFLAPEHRPESASIDFSKAWQEDGFKPEALREVIYNWRHQQRKANLEPVR